MKYFFYTYFQIPSPLNLARQKNVGLSKILSKCATYSKNVDFRLWAVGDEKKFKFTDFWMKKKLKFADFLTQEVNDVTNLSFSGLIHTYHTPNIISYQFQITDFVIHKNHTEI